MDSVRAMWLRDPHNRARSSPAFFRRTFPQELQRIVSQGAAERSDERYHLAKEMAIDLKNLRRDLELSAEIERSGPPMSPNLSSGFLVRVTSALTLRQPDL
jgi:hypothetical protein